MLTQGQSLVINTLTEASYKSLDPSQVLSSQLYIVDNDDANRTVIASYDLLDSRTSSISSIDQRLGEVEEKYLAKDTAATSSALGLVKVGYAENGRNYALSIDNGNACVCVPWSDTSSTAVTLDESTQILKITDSNGRQISASLSSLANTYVGDGKTISIVNNTIGVIDGAFQPSGDYAFTSSLTAYETKMSAEAKLSEAKSYTDTKISALDYADAAAEHQFVTKVDETDGKISVVRAALSIDDIPSLTSLYDSKGDAENSLTAAKAYADGISTSLSDDYTEKIDSARSDLCSYTDQLSNAMDGKLQQEITDRDEAIEQSAEDTKQYASNLLSDYYTKTYIDQAYVVKSWLSTATYMSGQATQRDSSLYVCKEDNVTGAWNSSKWLKLDVNLLIKSAVSAAVEPYFRDVADIDDMSLENLVNAVSSVFELCK